MSKGNIVLSAVFFLSLGHENERLGFVSNCSCKRVTSWQPQALPEIVGSISEDRKFVKTEDKDTTKKAIFILFVDGDL